jgi:hypothetical protein
MADTYFQNIPTIRFEGPETDNPLAFRYYDKNRMVLGKRNCAAPPAIGTPSPGTARMCSARELSIARGTRIPRPSSPPS